MEKETRLQELKDKMSSVGGYFGLTKEEKKEYSTLNKELENQKSKKKVEVVKSVVETSDNELAIDTEEDRAVSEAISEFETEEAEKVQTLTVSELSADDVKNSLWEQIKDGHARAAVLSIDREKPLLDELIRVKNDPRIAKEGQFGGYVQSYIDKLTK